MKAVVAAIVVVAAIIATLVFLRTRSSPLPAAQAHCASGIGGMALCSEWSGTLAAEQQLCQTLEGSWAGQPCPTSISAAGGTCVVRAPTHAGTIRYGSAWRERAAAHCTKRGGTYTAP